MPVSHCTRWRDRKFGWAACATARPRYGRVRTDEAFRGRPGTREHCYTWALPAEKGTLRYRFVSGEESTPWFETDILRPLPVTRPLRTGRGWAELCPGVYLCAEGEKGGAALTLRKAPKETESPLRFGGEAIWTLGTLSCTEITLLLRPERNARPDGNDAAGRSAPCVRHRRAL